MTRVHSKVPISIKSIPGLYVPVLYLLVVMYSGSTSGPCIFHYLGYCFIFSIPLQAVRRCILYLKPGSDTLYQLKPIFDWIDYGSCKISKVQQRFQQKKRKRSLSMKNIL